VSILPYSLINPLRVQLVTARALDRTGGEKLLPGKRVGRIAQTRGSTFSRG